MSPRVALFALLAAAIGSARPADAQETGRVQGRVAVSGTGAPLVGAQVFIDGTGFGTLTNDEGRFLILNVPAGRQTVRVQMIGYSSTQRSVTVAAGQMTTVDFELAETAVALDELVVTGTAAATRRKEVGNSVSAIDSRELELAPVVNSQQALTGRAPGVTIMTNSGQPGAGGTIKIRGTNTVSQITEPLIYVDGVRIFNETTRAGWGGRTGTNPLQDIAAEDIERIEVVKGAAATTLYGTEASAGVVQIFTKKGFAGDPVWNVEISSGINSMGHWGSPDDPTNLFVSCGNKDLLYGLSSSASDRGDRVYFEDPTCPESGEWTRNGPIQRYNLSVRGGKENVTYFLSGNFGDNRGVFQTQGSRDGGFRGNFTFSPLEALQFSLNTSYNRRGTRWIGDGNNAEGFLLNVGRGYRGYMQGGKEGDCDAVPGTRTVDGVTYPVQCVTNGYVFDGEFFTRNDHFTSGLTLAYNPTSSLSNRFTVGWDYTDINSETTLPFGYLTLPAGYYWDENTRHTKVSLDYSGSLRNTFGDDVASTVSWGAQLFRDRHRWAEIDVESFAGPGEPSLESGAVIAYLADRPRAETSAGFFFQEQLGYKDRLFVTAGLRVDGNSAFGENFGLQPYPKVSLAYTLSDHAFWPTDWFETLKLRGAMGYSGKAPGAFDRLRTWSPISADEGQPGFTPANIGNDEVGPERTREIEVGFDASFFQGRIGLEATAFQAKTFDALVGVQYPPSNGFIVERVENVGTVQNEGIELALRGGLLRTESIDWRARLNVSVMRSEALDLDGDPDRTTSIYTGLNSEIREGYAVPSYFGNRIMNPNAFADPVVVSDTFIGPVYPNKLYSIGTTLTIRNNLTLDALGEFQGGHYVQNYTGYQNARRGVWYPCYGVQEKLAAVERGLADPSVLNDVTALERGQCSFTDYDNFYWIEKADFFKLRSVSLSYNLPASWFRFARTASVSLAATNLWTLTDYTGSDPEVQDVADQQGVTLGSGDLGRRDYYQLPNPRTFLLSLRLSF